jgi:hypothetical protein
LPAPTTTPTVARLGVGFDGVLVTNPDEIAQRRTDILCPVILEELNCVELIKEN